MQKLTTLLTAATLSAVMSFNITTAQAQQAPEAKPTPTQEGKAEALALSDKLGISKLNTLTRLRFTWSHVSGKQRSYDWHIKANTVSVTLSPEAAPIKLNLSKTSDFNAEQIAAHQAFINDHYWLLFEWLITRDPKVEIKPLSADDLAQYKLGGVSRGLAIQYPKDGGYTPGDRYVLMLNATSTPIAWAYHRAGAEAPTLITTRQDHTEVEGMSLPTRFVKPDGSPFIQITKISAEP